jgi:hypothetical protein
MDYIAIGLIVGCVVDVVAVVYELGVFVDAISGDVFILVYNFGCR